MTPRLAHILSPSSLLLRCASRTHVLVTARPAHTLSPDCLISPPTLCVQDARSVTARSAPHFCHFSPSSLLLRCASRTHVLVTARLAHTYHQIASSPLLHCPSRTHFCECQLIQISTTKFLQPNFLIPPSTCASRTHFWVQLNLHTFLLPEYLLLHCASRTLSQFVHISSCAVCLGRNFW